MTAVIGRTARKSQHGAVAVDFERAPFLVIWEVTRAFVDHVGNICPSGFLPMPRGNVREGRLVVAYREDAVFRRLRDADALGGRCGRCEFRSVCGGSRSRAFAATGDAFGEDPLCAYEPADAAAVATR